MDTLRSNLDKVVQHGKRADAIVKNMLLHSHQGSGEHRPVAINAIVEESLKLAYHGARAEKQNFNIMVEQSFDPVAGEADIFPQEITRVLLNLISNGVYATREKTPPDGEIYKPTLTASTKDLGDHVEIRIRDNGIGISTGCEGKDVQSIFYDEACWRRHRPRPLHQSRYHCQATWRLDRGRYSAGRIHGSEDHPAANGGSQLSRRKLDLCPLLTQSGHPAGSTGSPLINAVQL